MRREGERVESWKRRIGNENHKAEELLYLTLRSLDSHGKQLERMRLQVATLLGEVSDGVDDHDFLGEALALCEERVLRAERWKQEIKEIFQIHYANPAPERGP